MKFLNKKKLFIMGAFYLATHIFNTQLPAADVAAVTQDPETLIEEAFDNAPDFATFIDNIIHVFEQFKETILQKPEFRNAPGGAEKMFNNLIIALKSLRNSTDVSVVKRRLDPFRNLLPTGITNRGTVAFATRVGILLYNNKGNAAAAAEHKPTKKPAAPAHRTAPARKKK
ncbi:MAG: hypothetical protein WCE21_02890 [Candidatus Babeliales bacterium]